MRDVEELDAGEQAQPIWATATAAAERRDNRDDRADPFNDEDDSIQGYERSETRAHSFVRHDASEVGDWTTGRLRPPPAAKLIFNNRTP